MLAGCHRPALCNCQLTQFKSNRAGPLTVAVASNWFGSVFPEDRGVTYGHWAKLLRTRETAAHEVAPFFTQIRSISVYLPISQICVPAKMCTDMHGAAWNVHRYACSAGTQLRFAP